jgi:hypothetical protein
MGNFGLSANNPASMAALSSGDGITAFLEALLHEAEQQGGGDGSGGGGGSSSGGGGDASGGSSNAQ